MPTSSVLAVPTRKDTKRSKSAETKSGYAKKATSGVVEVPVKREPKKEKKVVKTTRRKTADPPKKSARNTKRSTSASLDHTADTPSTEAKPNGPASPNNTCDENKSIDKKKSMAKIPAAKKKVSSKPKPKKDEFDLVLAQKFFKQMMESQPKTRAEQTGVETMPVSSDIAISVKSVKKHRKTRSPPLDRNIFKANGEPVWVVPDRKPGEKVEMNADGALVKYPELAEALAEDGVVMDDGKGWFQKMSQYFGGAMEDGQSGEKPPLEERNPLTSMDVLLQHNEDFFKKEQIQYNTAESIYNLYGNAIEKFMCADEQDTAARRRAAQEAADKKGAPKKEEPERTCIDTTIRFNMNSIFSIKYDRRKPIASIQKFRKKYQQKLKLSAEQPTQSPPPV